MTFRWLVLQLDAPLMSFGSVAIDQVGPIRDFPAASMLTGLIGNALGWNWWDREAHQLLQSRLIFASRWQHPGATATVLTDTQNAQLAKTDKGWTTLGEPEGREGASYGAPHRRFRDYHADLSVRIVIRLEPPEDSPTEDAIAAALDHPARPLFLGRKSCLPAGAVVGPGTSALDLWGQCLCSAVCVAGAGYSNPSAVARGPRA